jgi:hypothetical protein
VLNQEQVRTFMTNLVMNSLRILEKSQLDPLLDLIDAQFPCLREDLLGLSELLSFFIKHGRLPPYKLELELLSREQLESIRFKEWSLKELLEPCELHIGDYPIDDPPAHGDSPADGDCAELSGLFADVPPDRNLSRPTYPSMSMQGCISMASIELPTSTAELDQRSNLLCDNVIKKPDALNLSSTKPSSRLDKVFLISPIVLLPFSLIFIPFSS